MRFAAVCVASFALTGLGAAGSQAAFPAAKGRLAIVTEDHGFVFVTLLRSDGSRLPFGFPDGINGTAAVSPDGTRLAMVETVALVPGTTPPSLVVTDLLGGYSPLAVGRVTGRASWSPDGTRIAYAGQHNGNWDIFVVAASAGAKPVDLTQSSTANELEPRWAPGGTKIAFESDRSGNLDVYTMNADGSDVADLTNDPSRDTLGDWSPDSQRLVFSSSRSGNGDLYVLPAAGGAPMRLTSDPGSDTRAVWSPDGSTIAYSSDVAGENDVYEIAPDGSAGKQVTSNAHEDLVQDWQPLRDLSPPIVHALRSSGVRGGRLRFRFRLSENSGRANVELTFSFRSYAVSAGEPFERVRSAHVYTMTLPPGAAREAPRSFRFCIEANDSSANPGRRSCARYYVLKRKRKR